VYITKLSLICRASQSGQANSEIRRGAA